MVGFNLEIHKADFETETILNYELFFDLDNDCASFRILMSKSEFEELKKIVNNV